MNSNIWRAALLMTPLIFCGIARADSVFVETLSEDFGTYNLSTGAFTPLGNNGNLTDGFLYQILFLGGLGEANGNLYGVHQVATSADYMMYQLNTSTGAETLVGDTDIGDLQGFGSTANGLYAIEGASGDPSYSFYSIDPVTGAGTFVGFLGLPVNSVTIGASAVSDTGALYITLGSDLYSVDTSTGAATLIGNLGSAPGVDNGMNSLLFEKGTLYGTSYTGSLGDPTNVVYTLNTSTGLATAGIAEQINASGPNPTILTLLALDPVPPASAVPEPASVALLSLVAILCALKYRARKTA